MNPYRHPISTPVPELQGVASIARQADAAMIELHCRCCKRSVEFSRSSFPDVPSWVARIEHDKCNVCDDGDRSAEHWIAADGSEPDPDLMPSVDDERPCTCCEGTGITIQTERKCACQP